MTTDFNRVPGFGWGVFRQVGPAFCIPENKELRQYWDRVEDRLFKIRHCLDITGARRELALFAPEIDPRLLVRARAEGLTLEDVLNATSGNLPPYRFTYLIEKARQFAGVVQSFGTALLSALEKRDVEELNLLREVHQQNLARLTTRLREWEIEAEDDAIAGLEAQKATAEYRRGFYQGLIDKGLTAWEHTQAISRHTASVLNGVAALFDINASIAHLLPQVGSPFALTYGGHQLGKAAESWADSLRQVASVAEVVSASAGLEAGFDRREEEWKHQLELAKKELAQLEKQLAAARVRRKMAERSLEMHQQSLEQMEEIFDFYRERFTNLDLYTWVAAQLQRLYREAYNSAYAVARLAEQAYGFERGDDGPLLGAQPWKGGRAGLLAGEGLLLDLQHLERRFLETNYRTLEIEQSFSLSQINPGALLELRQNARCNFDLTELFFDLFYPGQYRRMIRAVRLTIPCVAGPYTNVSATLTLQSSQLRKEPKLGTALGNVPRRHSATIATSAARNDGGVFELSFRDERYLPFEGAGAVSSWELRLPASFRAFDYESITDVILHLSYTAEYAASFQDEVEALAAGTVGTILQQIARESLARVFSLKHDFPTEWSAFVNGTDNLQITLRKDHFPYLAQAKKLKLVIEALELHEPKDGQVEPRTVADLKSDKDRLETLANELDGQGHSDQTFQADTDLKRNAEQVFLFMRYHLALKAPGGTSRGAGG